jgi:hypothetical protein
MMGASTMPLGGINLPLGIHKASQKIGILEVDLVDLILTKMTDLFFGYFVHKSWIVERATWNVLHSGAMRFTLCAMRLEWDIFDLNFIFFIQVDGRDLFSRCFLGRSGQSRGLIVGSAGAA